MASAISFQGLSTHLQTDKLVEAILQQQKSPIERMQAKQDQNKLRSSLIRTLKTNLQALNTTIGTLGTAFDGRSVTSSDPAGTYVTASAGGAATGTYDVKVKEVASKARFTSSVATSAMASLGGQPVNGKYEYAITNTDGKATKIALSESSNTMEGLREAINARSAEIGVNATIVQGSPGQFKLVITANETGLGNAASTVENPENARIYLKGSAGNALETSITEKGTPGVEQAKNAHMVLNGIDIERKSNVISDVVEGVSFTVKSKSDEKTTSFTVALDKTGITAAMNDVVSKFNAVFKTYKENSVPGGVLSGDFTLRAMINQAHAALMGTPNGLSLGNSFQTAANLGLKTGKDGTLSVDSAVLQDALDKDVAAASELAGKIDTAFQVFVDHSAGYSSGSLTSILSNIDSQNFRLSKQITDANSRLEKKREALMLQYSNLESTVGRLQSMGQSLGGLR